MEAELKQKLTKAKRQLLALKAKLGDATSARDAALAQLQDQVTPLNSVRHVFVMSSKQGWVSFKLCT